MTWATVGRLERLRDHYEAGLFYNSVSPIRGRAEDVRPLGARRDADRYRILKKDDAYVARLYNTDVITFLPNGEVVINTGGFNTGLTMQFIAEVLGIGAARQRGTCVYRISGENYITKGNEELRIKHIGNNHYDIISKNQHFQYVINRTGANNVRKRTAEFRGYLRGFESLRSQEVNQWGNNMMMVCIPTGEFADMFGKVTHYVNYHRFDSLTRKRENHKKFLEQSWYLDALITSGDSTKYYEAAMLLAASCSEYALRTDKPTAMIGVGRMVEMLDESQFKLFSKEVFTYVEVKKGQVPNPKYDSWVDSNDSDYD